MAKRRKRVRVKPRFFVFVAILVLLLSGLFRWLDGAHGTFTSDGFKHDSRFEDCLVIDGLDVSYAQDTSVDYDALKSSGNDFVFVRAGYRGTTEGQLYDDDTFETNVNAAHDAGLLVGAYYYSQATSEDESYEEALEILRIVEGYTLELPLVIDYEIYEGGRLEEALNEELSRSDVNNILDTWCGTIEEAGYESCIYANVDLFDQFTDSGELAKNHNLWVAHYSEKCRMKDDYEFWQCSDSYQFDGLSAAADKNFWYLDSKQIHFSKAVSDAEVSIADCDIKVGDGLYVGYPVEAFVKVSLDKKPLERDLDYTVNYVKNCRAGKGYALIRGIGKYKDMIVKEFTISE